MKVYIASFFADKDRVVARANELHERGIQTTMRWPYETAPHNCTITDFPAEYFRETAVADIQDIVAADVLVLIIPTDKEMSDLTARSLARGGRHFEAGFMYGLMYYALKMAMRLPVRQLILCGPRENVFHSLDGQSVTQWYPTIKQFDTWDEVKEHLMEQTR
jgi:hypothetical protein